MRLAGTKPVVAIYLVLTKGNRGSCSCLSCYLLGKGRECEVLEIICTLPMTMCECEIKGTYALLTGKEPLISLALVSLNIMPRLIPCLHP